MAIKWTSDLGAPVLVTVVDLTLEATAPDYSKYATGIMAVGGYVGAGMGWGGDFIKNVGIASLPAFAKNIYDYARGGMERRPTQKLAFKRTAARPSIAQTPGPGMDIIKPLY